MKREERHHLKENAFAALLTDLRLAVAARERSLLVGAALVVLVALGAGGFMLWQQRQAEQAGDLLGQAMAVLDAQVIPPAAGDGAEPEPFEQPPGSYPSLTAKLEAALPSLVAAADGYPNTTAGVTARYHAATALSTLGRADEAAGHYEQVIATGADGLHGQLARLGLAEARLVSGDYAGAISLLETESAQPDSLVPVDAVLMRLGEAYQQAGQADDALAAFTRVTEEFGDSVYATAAREEADALQQGAGAASD